MLVLTCSHVYNQKSGSTVGDLLISGQGSVASYARIINLEQISVEMKSCENYTRSKLINSFGGLIILQV